MQKEKAAQIYRKLCAEIEDHEKMEPGSFTAYRDPNDEEHPWIIGVCGNYGSWVKKAAMMSYVAQFLEAWFGDGVIVPADAFAICVADCDVPKDAPEDMNIFDELFEALPPHAEGEPPMFAVECDDVVTQCEDAATAVADFFHSMGYDTPTGFYDPVVDKRNDEVNSCTGLYYVSFAFP